MRKLVLALILLSAISTKAQQCSVTWGPWQWEETNTNTAAISGLNLNGVGQGEIAGDFIAVTASESLASGNFTVVSEITTLLNFGGAPSPQAGFEFFFSGLYPRAVVYVKNVNGNLTVYFDIAEKTQHGIQWINIGSQTVSGLNFSIKAARSYNILTAYLATDNVNFVSLGSTSAISTTGATLSFFVASGDGTSYTNAVFTGTLVNGAPVSSASFNLPPVDGLTQQVGLFIQPGDLTVGPNLISGSVSVANCGSSITLDATDELKVLDLTTQQTLYDFNFSFASVSPCNTGCSMAQTMPANAQPFIIYHGHHYQILDQIEATVYTGLNGVLSNFQTPLRTLDFFP